VKSCQNQAERGSFNGFSLALNQAPLVHSSPTTPSLRLLPRVFVFSLKRSRSLSSASRSQSLSLKSQPQIEQIKQLSISQSLVSPSHCNTDYRSNSSEVRVFAVLICSRLLNFWKLSFLSKLKAIFDIAIFGLIAF